MGVPGKGGENLHSYISFLPAAGSGLTTYVHITAYSTKVYFEATHQWLNRETAAHIAKYMPPFEGEDVRQREARRIFFNVMVMNPSVEVYLLDPTGKIHSYYDSPPNP